MRLSMLAVIAVAVVIGLGVVFAVKTLGLLSTPAPPPAAEKPVPPPPPAPPAPPTVMVPVRPLYVGDTISPFDIRVRPLRPEEMKDYEAHKDEILPAVPEIVYYRFPARDLHPDQMLRRDDLLEVQKPLSLNERLIPGTRAVSVGIEKEHCVGGLIQVGDWVDVYLITNVSRTDSESQVPHTGLLVPHAQVIAKRDTLYSIYAPLPEGQPIPFTLATNPFRAALIEYGRTVGRLTLVPVSANEKQRLDKLREEALGDPSKTLAVTFASPDSELYQEEQDRIAGYENGNLVIGAEQLAEVLKLPVIEPPAAPPSPPEPDPAAPAPEPVTIQTFSGTTKTGVVSFPVPHVPSPRSKPLPKPVVPPPAAKYQFTPPAKAQGSGSRTPTN